MVYERRNLLFELHTVDIVQELVELHNAWLFLDPLQSESLKGIAVERVHQLVHLLACRWYWVLGIKNERVYIHSVDLVFSIIQRIE